MYCLHTISAIINCGGNQMAPDCSYCPVNEDRLYNTWCSGNCKLDDIDGTCKEIKGICRNKSYLTTLFINLKYYRIVYCTLYSCKMVRTNFSST